MKDLTFVRSKKFLLVIQKKISKKFDFSDVLRYTTYCKTSMLIMITSISPIHGVLSG